ncbi:hypothetical protein DA469_04585 [Bacillus subtilis]|nr:hypothetical protein DA469_04585 [Bacillus subtilis]
MKLNQFLKSDVEVAKRKSDSVESMADLLLASLKDGDYEEALDILGSIKANIEDLKRISNKGLLYDTALKMQKRGIDLSLVRRSLADGSLCPQTSNSVGGQSMV